MKKRKNPFPTFLRNTVTLWTSKQQWTWMNMFININKCINMTGMWNNVHQKHTAEQQMLHNSIIYILKTILSFFKRFCEDLCTYAQSHHKEQEHHEQELSSWCGGSTWWVLCALVSTDGESVQWHQSRCGGAHVGLMCTSRYRWGVHMLASIMWCGGSSAGSLYSLVFIQMGSQCSGMV